MPQRHKQRFGRLHATLKATGYSATNGPAGEYLNYLKGTNKLTVPRKPAANLLKTFNVGVIPFGQEPDNASGAKNAYETSITVQADNIKTLFVALAPDTLFGIERDLTKCEISEIFYAAQCHISVVPTNSLTGGKQPATSNITKQAYKKYPGIRSGSIPYGRTTNAPAAQTEGGTPVATPTIATESEEDSRLSISNALKKGVAQGEYTVYALRFIPEEFVEPRSFSKTRPTDAPTGIPTN